MLNLKIISLGSLKETHWQEAAAEYLKRLTPYAKIEEVVLKEESFQPHDDKDMIKEKEATKLLSHIQPTDTVIVMHERGKMFDSPAFAKWLETNSASGQQIVIAIGGPLGWHQSILDRANLQLSFSSFTFPHQLAKVLLLEQLYRAVTIQKGKTYHY